jgi:hypothetical protein
MKKILSTLFIISLLFLSSSRFTSAIDKMFNEDLQNAKRNNVSNMVNVDEYFAKKYTHAENKYIDMNEPAQAEFVFNIGQ